MTTTLKMNHLSEAGAAFLLLSLAAACGPSHSNDPADGGTAPKDGGSSAANGGSSAMNGGSSAANGGSSAANGGSSAANGGSSAANGGRSAGIDGGSAAADGGRPLSDGGASAGLPIELGSAGHYVILAKSGVSTVPTAAVTGDVGVSPAAASYITGFTLTADSTNEFSTSPQVTGRVYAADYASPTPSNMTTAVSDMELAFADAAARAPDVIELGAGSIGGMTLEPGVYQWGTGLSIAEDVTLTGSATAVWIFQVAEDLTMSSAKSIFLTGGALPKNVFWQVAGEVVLGTTAHFEGVVLTQTAITMRTGASINGRLLAQTAVIIDSSTIVEPSP
jgi:hypothetical protein